MSETLLAAEADKIQDLIFRSSHLREVVGGSQMLSNFCKKVADQLTSEHGGDVIISDGGSFRVAFKDDDEKGTKAKKFGDALAEAYREIIGGTITVAGPVFIVNGDFEAAHNEAHQKLRAAKQHQPHVIASEHTPYMAFCVSCGVGLAEKHEKLHKNDRRAQYLCSQCLQKSKAWEDERMDSFLSPFYALLEQESVSGNIPVAEEIAELDPRNYVAYMVADGNNMGKVFGQIDDPEQLGKLSVALPNATRKSLAEATHVLIELSEVSEKMGDRVAVLPLILGGDDLFVLLPAPWAIDFAYRFAQAYEREMAEAVKDLSGVPQPTISIAVIICKAKYPYYLAHQRGEELLSETKKIIKRWAVDTGNSPPSAINFEVILGNRLAGEDQSEGHHRPTLRPFWVLPEDQQETDDIVPGWGIYVHHLIGQRYELSSLPRKRLAQLRAHFDRLTDLPDDDDKRELWVNQLEKILDRALQVSGEEKGKKIDTAVAKLGGKDLFKVSRTTDRKDWHGHALPDLIAAWDFTYDLNRSRNDYEE